MAVGETPRYFALKVPIAVKVDRGVIVCADPGHTTDTELRSWRAAHQGLWAALRKRSRVVQVVGIIQEDRVLERAEAVLQNWAGGIWFRSFSRDPSAAREIARIEQAILQGDPSVLDEVRLST